MNLRRLVASLAALALACVAAACSLPTDHTPRAIERSKLPAILEPSQSPTTTVVGVNDAKDAQICFANEGNVQCVQRKVNEVSPDVLFETLVAGPTEEERNEGYSSYVPPATRLIDSTLVDHVLTLNLTDAIQDLSVPNNKPAYAQIVYTMIKSIPTVRNVAVKVDGKPTKIPADTGPVLEAGLKDFAMPAPTTTARTPTKDDTAAPTPSLGN